MQKMRSDFPEIDKVKRDVKYRYSILIPSRQEVRTLIQKLWIPESRKTILCIDSYRDGILQGRFYGPDGEEQSFCSLSCFLVMMEEMLELMGEPQSDTSRRSFTSLLQQPPAGASGGGVRRGLRATFELKILFRQHTSWQGVVLWMEQHRERSFRSVLELILLLDSALREPEVKDVG